MGGELPTRFRSPSPRPDPQVRRTASGHPLRLCHHRRAGRLALRTPNGDTIRSWRERIAGAGLEPSPVIDRHYFESVYTRVPGGILIEIATDTGTPFRGRNRGGKIDASSQARAASGRN